MLAEVLRYVTTFAPEPVRKHGYLKKLIDLEFRYKRGEHAWADHILNCRTFIVTAAENAPSSARPLFLGLGCL